MADEWQGQLSLAFILRVLTYKCSLIKPSHQLSRAQGQIFQLQQVGEGHTHPCHLMADEW